MTALMAMAVVRLLEVVNDSEAGRAEPSKLDIRARKLMAWMAIAWGDWGWMLSSDKFRDQCWMFGKDCAWGFAKYYGLTPYALCTVQPNNVCNPLFTMVFIQCIPRSLSSAES